MLPTMHDILQHAGDEERANTLVRLILASPQIKHAIRLQYGRVHSKNAGIRERLHLCARLAEVGSHLTRQSFFIDSRAICTTSVAQMT